MTVAHFLVVVGSQNPSKLGCVQKSFELYAQQIKSGQPEYSFSFSVIGVVVESGVSQQPRGHEETQRGALQRLRNAIDARPDADFWVTLESGIAEETEEKGGKDDSIKGTMWEIGYVAVISRQSRSQGIPPTLTRNVSFAVPPRLAEMIRTGGHEMGPACDLLWGGKNTGQHSGMIGHITGGGMTRGDIAGPAVLAALFIHTVQLE